VNNVVCCLVFLVVCCELIITTLSSNHRLQNTNQMNVCRQGISLFNLKAEHDDHPPWPMVMRWMMALSAHLDSIKIKAQLWYAVLEYDGLREFVHR
jgi:hypothetical protein